MSAAHVQVRLLTPLGSLQYVHRASIAGARRACLDAVMIPGELPDDGRTAAALLTAQLLHWLCPSGTFVQPTVSRKVHNRKTVICIAGYISPAIRRALQAAHCNSCS